MEVYWQGGDDTAGKAGLWHGSVWMTAQRLSVLVKFRTVRGDMDCHSARQLGRCSNPEDAPHVAGGVFKLILNYRLSLLNKCGLVAGAETVSKSMRWRGRHMANWTGKEGQ